MNGSGVGVAFHSVDLQRLRALAEQLHRRLPLQVVIALRGQLGAGKTRFTQEIAAAAGVDAGDVTSPTFTLVQHYRGSRTLHHIDAYRLADEDEFIELGGEELFEDEAMVLVEWPERIAQSLPRRTLFLEIEIDDDTSDAVAASAGVPPPDATRTIWAHSQDPALMAILQAIGRELNHSHGAEP